MDDSPSISDGDEITLVIMAVRHHIQYFNLIKEQFNVGTSTVKLTSNHVLFTSARCIIALYSA